MSVSRFINVLLKPVNNEKKTWCQGCHNDLQRRNGVRKIAEMDGIHWKSTLIGAIGTLSTANGGGYTGVVDTVEGRGENAAVVGEPIGQGERFVSPRKLVRAV